MILLDISNLNKYIQNINYRGKDLEENNTDILNQTILLDTNPNN